MTHRFDPDAVDAVARQGLGLPTSQAFETVIAGLQERYPRLISADQPWVFSNAGGAMIQVKFLYASLTEYVALFGTPVGTEGHSGRNWAEFHDTVLAGEAWYYQEGDLQRTVYKAGDRIHVRRLHSAGMHIPDHVWMLEYCRGALPTMMPFGLADTFLSTLDFRTAWLTLRIYAVLVIRALRASSPPAA